MDEIAGLEGAVMLPQETTSSPASEASEPLNTMATVQSSASLKELLLAEGGGTTEELETTGKRDANAQDAPESADAAAAANLEATEESMIGSGPSPEHLYSMNVAEYSLGAVIGFGSSAIVYMAKYLPLGTDVAVKMIELDHFERNRIDELRKEIQVMALCKHPNLLGILTSFVHESKLWIVTPFLAGGSCLDIIKSGFKDGFEEAVIATILVQALQGLEYLHDHGHIHRDLKCGNLLMAEDGLVQLADFGVSSSLMEDGDRRGVRKTYVGTPCWMAPEVMEITRGYDFKADIWSFGITALELAYGHAPYAKFPPMKVIYLTLSGKPPTLDRKQAVRKYSRAFKEMVDCCLQRDPAKRPTAKQLLKHPFFKAAKKRGYLAEAVFFRVPSVHQRDKSAQLRARGLAVDVPSDAAGAASNAVMDDQGCADASMAGVPSSSLAIHCRNHFSEDTAESWDFSLDNSTAPDEDVPFQSASAAFDAIAEEDEASLDSAEGNVLERDGTLGAVESPSRPVSLVSTDESSAGSGSFHGLQRGRTSRFIVGQDREQGKESPHSGSLDASTEGRLPDTHESIDECVLHLAEIEPSISASSSFDPSSTHLHVPHPCEVKKGRFSVLESVNAEDEDPRPESLSASADSIVASPLPGNEIAALDDSEEKKSRFEVTLTMQTAEEKEPIPWIAQDPNALQPPEHLSHSASSLYFQSPSGPASLPYPIHNPVHHSHFPTPSHYPHPHPHSRQMAGYVRGATASASQHLHYHNMAMAHGAYPNHISSHLPSHHHLPSQLPHGHSPHHSQHPLFSPMYSAFPSYPVVSLPCSHRGSVSIGTGPSGLGDQPHPLASGPPHSNASPGQLDHLLQVNDYIRGQLLELQHSAHQQGAVSAGVAAHPPPRPHSSFNPVNQVHFPYPVHQHHQPPNASTAYPHYPHSPPSVPMYHTSQTPYAGSCNCAQCSVNDMASLSNSNELVAGPPGSAAQSTNTAYTTNSATTANSTSIVLTSILTELEAIKRENEQLKAQMSASSASSLHLPRPSPHPDAFDSQFH